MRHQHLLAMSIAVLIATSTACKDVSPETSLEFKTDRIQEVTDNHRIRLSKWAESHPKKETELFFMLDGNFNHKEALHAARAQHKEQDNFKQRTTIKTIKDRTASQLKVPLGTLKSSLPKSCRNTFDHGALSPFAWCMIKAEDVGRLPEKFKGAKSWSFNTGDESITLNCNDPNDSKITDLSEITDELRTVCANRENFFAEDIPVGQTEGPYPPYEVPNYWTMSANYQSQSPNRQKGKYQQFQNNYSVSQQTCGTTISTIFGFTEGSEHSTAVASMIGSRNEEDDLLHAARATFYYADEGEGVEAGPRLLTCEGNAHGRMVKMYEWFATNKVRVYNESYHCGDPPIWSKERIRDYFTRYFDITLVRSAGNLEDSPEIPLSLEKARNPVVCRGFNNICVGASRLAFPRNLDEGDTQVSQVSSISRWKNAEGRDREEPDVVAPGDSYSNRTFPGGIEALSGDGTTCAKGDCDVPFNSVRGTSIASPTVVGMIALAFEQIAGGHERCRSSEWTRALIKASAIDHKIIGREVVQASGPIFVIGTEYDVPRLGRHDINAGDLKEDDYHGAGRPNFARMLGWKCPKEVESPEDDCTLLTPEKLEDLPDTSNLPTLDRIHPVGAGFDHPHTAGVSQTSRGLSFKSNINSPPIADGGKCGIARDPSGPKIECALPPEKGEVWLSRIVLDWSSCPGQIPSNPENTSNNEIRPATDFNLAMTTPKGDQYWMSTSFDDTSESFEFCHTEQGDYDIMMIPTVENFGCPGIKDPSKKGERYYIMESRTRVDKSECPGLSQYKR